ncbi:uncharacterized protein EI90DRAFT_1257566 [Cantharellus anzutake]|uniref:uncharacterized protein n=1 Tax=Cantharellus anzutake TaxID=1750568 RepID=UPI001908AC50|nr:uncharacterized protein EI90DRAFT_1257566 [Cantharellus anzutake]KAF8330020.1 hypothetical protein EI90DRAFT_1257566 [Cantharellus anzutake]
MPIFWANRHERMQTRCVIMALPNALLQSPRWCLTKKCAYHYALNFSPPPISFYSVRYREFWNPVGRVSRMSKLCVPCHSPHHLLCDLPATFTPLIIISLKPTCSWDLHQPHRLISARVAFSCVQARGLSRTLSIALGHYFSDTRNDKHQLCMYYYIVQCQMNIL